MYIYILCSDTASQITPFSRECFFTPIKTAVKPELGKKTGWKR